MLLSRVFATAVAVCLVSSLGASATVVYSEDWDNPGNGVAGWQGNTIATTVFHQAAGGNPNGYLGSSGTVTASFDIGATTELAAASGNYAAAGITQVSFDVLLLTGQFDDAWFRVRFQDSTSNGWRISLTDDFGLGLWNSYSIAFNPNWSDANALLGGWVQEGSAPSFAATMADVYHPEVRLSGEGSLEAGIDNFVLSSNPIPEPATMTLLGLGLAGLAYRNRRRSAR
jgi:hypothetical protein